MAFKHLTGPTAARLQTDQGQCGFHCHYPLASVQIGANQMLTLRFNGPTERYVATVLPIIGLHGPAEYQVLVYRRGLEVYEDTRLSLEEAIHTASIYIAWRTDQDSNTSSSRN